MSLTGRFPGWVEPGPGHGDPDTGVFTVRAVCARIPAPAPAGAAWLHRISSPSTRRTILATALLGGSVVLLLVCLACALAAAYAPRRVQAGTGEDAAARARAGTRYRTLARRAGALAVVLMVASKCAQ